MSGTPPDDAIAALRREFAAGLPARVRVLRVALHGIKTKVTRAVLQAFHLAAHSLQGTAGSYQADELVPHVARLATLGRKWFDTGTASLADVAEAMRELDGLDAAVERFRGRLPH